MQDLPTYLAGKRKADFARAVSISPAYLSQILSRQRTPSYEVAQRIADATGGKVPLSAWVGWKASASEDAA